MKNELSTIPESTLANPSTGALIGAVIQSGVTKENVDVIERLVALREREDAKQAERDFNASFVKLQSEIPVIVASSIIPNRGKYERFEDVMRVISPLLQANGFAVSFEQGADDKREKLYNRHLSFLKVNSVCFCKSHPAAFAASGQSPVPIEKMTDRIL